MIYRTYRYEYYKEFKLWSARYARYGLLISPGKRVLAIGWGKTRELARKDLSSTLKKHLKNYGH